MLKKIIAFVLIATFCQAEVSIKGLLGYLQAKSDQAYSHITNNDQHIVGANKIRFDAAITNGDPNAILNGLTVIGTNSTSYFSTTNAYGIGPTIANAQLQLFSDGTNTYQRDVNSITGKVITTANGGITNGQENVFFGSTTVEGSGLSIKSYGSWSQSFGYMTVQHASNCVLYWLDGDAPWSNNDVSLWHSSPGKLSIGIAGKNANGSLSLSNLNAKSLNLSTNGYIPTETGSIGWDSLWTTPAIKLGSNVTGKIFADDITFVTNTQNIAIWKGAAVYVRGSAGGLPTVYLLTSTNLPCRANPKGIAAEAIPPYCGGFVTTRGRVAVDTGAYLEGDTLYATTVAGVMTNLLPQFPEDQISMATVSEAGSSGSVFVNIRLNERQEENLVGTYYGFLSKLSDVANTYVLTNDFGTNAGYTTYSTNIANGGTIAKFISGVSRVTAIAQGTLILKVFGDASKAGGAYVSAYVYDTNLVKLVTFTSPYTAFDTTPVVREFRAPIATNMSFNVPVRLGFDIIAQHGFASVSYNIYSEDGRPLSAEIPLPSGQFAFKSDLANYTPLSDFQNTNALKVNVNMGVASNLTHVGNLVLSGTDKGTGNGFFPQSNGLQVVGSSDQDLYIGLGGVVGRPAWWMQTYRNENPSSTNNPEFLYFSNGQSEKDFLMLSEGGRMSVNKTPNLIDYHSDYLGYISGKLNDISFSGTYTYSKQRKYQVSIVSTGAVDRWTWKKSLDNGLTFTESGLTNDCSTNLVSLENGMLCKFDSVTGHNTNDAWMRVGFAQLPAATAHLAPAAYDELGFTTNYSNASGWEDLTYTMASTVHSSDRYALTNTQSAIYLGRKIKMNSTFFNLAEYASGLSLVFEYWNGTSWQTITSSHNLSDGTANFTQSGQVSWDKSLLTNWTTNGIAGRGASYEMYWIRVRTSSNPTVYPRIRNITPQGKVRLGVMGRQYDEDYSWYVDGFGSSYQVKGYQTDTGATFEASQLITAGAVNKLLDAFRNYTFYFSTNMHPVLPLKTLQTAAQSSFTITTNLLSGTNIVATFVSTNKFGSTSIPANTKYSTAYYASKSANQGADSFWQLVEVGIGVTNVIAQSQATPLVQTTPTLIATTATPSTNVTVSTNNYIGVRVFGVRTGNAVAMTLYGGGSYESSLTTPTLGGAPTAVNEAPVDNIAYGRKNASWVQVLEPNGSGAALSGVVKTTDPKYMNAITNITVYTPVTNITGSSSVTVSVKPEQKIYKISTTAAITTFSNDLSALTFGNSNASWEVWIDYQTNTALSTGWATNIEWTGETPELTVTGCYHFAMSSFDGVSVKARQTYPTIHDKKPWPLMGCDDNLPAWSGKSDQFFSYMQAPASSSKSIALAIVPENDGLVKMSFDYLWYCDNATTLTNTIGQAYITFVEGNENLTKNITTNLLSLPAATYIRTNIVKIVDSKLMYADNRMAYVFFRTELNPTDASANFLCRLHRIGTYSQRMNELEIKAYNAGKRDW